ncbi:MAG: hypothetical protein M3Q99_13775 [Acidobacteriota bacterium]|nr:hypothetical protein [Acidobacteriota bacterium]
MENTNRTREIIIEIRSRRTNVGFSRMPQYEIYRRGENGKFYLMHDSTDEVQTCLNSLQNHESQKNTADLRLEA